MPRPTMKTIFKILFAPILWLSQACSPIGNPVDKELSDNHYYNNSKTKIIYSPMGNWFELGKNEMQVDMESFQVLNGAFSKDKDHVYHESHIVEHPQLDVASFHAKPEVFMTNIGLDKNNVYVLSRTYQEGNGTTSATIIKGADPDSYSELDSDWGKDAAHYFFKHRIVEVDYDSFKNLHSNFSKDGKKVYYHYADQFAPFKADVLTFKMLEDSDYAVDKDNVYRLSFGKIDNKNTRLLTLPRPQDGAIELFNSEYLRSGETIYFSGKEIEAADDRSFRVISARYAKDQHNVYFEDQVIQGADLATFQISSDGLSVHDKHGSYRNGELITKKGA